MTSINFHKKTNNQRHNDEDHLLQVRLIYKAVRIISSDFRLTANAILLGKSRFEIK